MLRPSYTELMDIINNEQNMDMKITSRYTIVIAAAKRARQLIDGAMPLSYAKSDKAVSTAIHEMYDGKLNITTSKDNDANEYEDNTDIEEKHLDKLVSE